MGWRFWIKKREVPETILLSEHQEATRKNNEKEGKLLHLISALESEVRTKHTYIGQLMRQLEVVSQASLKQGKKENKEESHFYGDDLPTLKAFNMKQREVVLDVADEIDTLADSKEIGGAMHTYMHTLTSSIRDILGKSDVFV